MQRNILLGLDYNSVTWMSLTSFWCYIVNVEHYSGVSIVEFEQVIAGWIKLIIKIMPEFILIQVTEL